MIKRCIAVLISLFLYCPAVFAAPFVDTVDTKYDNAIEVVNRLEIMNGYEDGTFRPELSVSRAEFAVILYRIVTQRGEFPTEYKEFSDVSEEHWAYRQINTVAALGLMGTSQDTFLPEREMTGSEVVFSFINLLGREKIAELSGGYPSGYQKAASSAGLLKGISASGASRGEIAQMIYNALDIPVLQETGFGQASTLQEDRDRTLLYEYFHLVKVKGSLTANAVSSLDGSEGENNSVRIDGVKYRDECGAGNMLGNYAHWYIWRDPVGHEEDAVRFYIVPQNKNIVRTVYDEDIVASRTGLSTFTYYVDGQEEKMGLSPSVSLIYNGEGMAEFTEELLIPDNGWVRLIDWEGDGSVDVVEVTNIQTRVVSNVDTYREMIFDQFGEPPVSLDEYDDVVFIGENNKELSLADIKEGNTLSIAEGKNKWLLTIYVSTLMTSSPITEISNDTVTIDGNEYRLAKGLRDEVDLNTRATFYIDISRRVVRMNSDYAAATGLQYGYLTGLEMKEGLSEEVRARIFTAKSEHAIYDLKKSVQFEYGGETVKLKAAEVAKRFSEGGGFTPQLILYSLNAEGEVNTISKYEERLNDRYWNESFAMNVKNLNKEQRFYNNTAGIHYRLDPEITKVFIIPDDRDDLDSYNAGGVDLVGRDARLKNFEFYNTTSDRIPGAMIIYEAAGSVSTELDETKARADVVVIQSVTSAINAAGEEVLNFTYNLKGTEKSATTPAAREVHNTYIDQWKEYGADIKASDLKSGDICQLFFNSKGEISEFHMVFRYNPSQPDAWKETIREGKAMSKDVVPLEYLYTAYGKVMDVSSKSITVSVFQDEDPMGYRNFGYTGTTKFVLVNTKKKGNNVSNITKNEICVGDRVFVRTYNYIPYTVVVYR